MLKVQQPNKRLIAFLDEDEYHKAKACDEMLLYEKPAEQQAVQDIDAKADDALSEFKRSLKHYITETTLELQPLAQ